MQAHSVDGKQLRQYVSQALEAAGAQAEGGTLSSPFIAATHTPQVARRGTADASSSHLPERHYSFTSQPPVHDDETNAPMWQAGPASPHLPSRSHLLIPDAVAAQQAGQQAHISTCSKQRPAFQARSSKKTHPLYTPASAPRQHRQAHQKKAIPKLGTGFAIRQPAPSAAALAPCKPVNTAEALRQLTGAHANTQAAASHRQNPPSARQQEGSMTPQARPGSIAELLSDIRPVHHDDAIEDIDTRDQQLHLLSPSRQDNARSLLNSVLEGEAQHAEGSLPQPAASPWTPAVRPAPAQGAGQDPAATPSMTLQRQFIASLQDTPVSSASQFTVGRSRAAPGSLTARLDRVLQLEKAQQAQFEAAGTLGRQTMNVSITEHRLDGHVIKCRCCKEGNEADQVFVMFNSKLSRDVNLSVGSYVTLHAPWTELQLAGCSTLVILCQYVSACA